jgi:CelD/BcsL family acetyltransferase involved in cellulose biosynthesis
VFDYLVNEYNPAPRLVTERTHPPHGLVRHLPFSSAIVVDLPSTVEELRARQPGRYWSELRRRERRFTEEFGPLRSAAVTDPEELRVQLPRVRELYEERWRGEYTSLPWKHEAGFRAYADALVELAGQGRAQLRVVEGDDRLLAFGYLLLARPWAHLYQHAATPAEAYRRYGVGKLLIADLVQDLVAEGYGHLDLMLGDAAYKREWETRRRPVHLELREPDTFRGHTRLVLRTGYHRARLHGQFSSPHLRRVLKRSLAVLDDGRARTDAC